MQIRTQKANVFSLERNYFYNIFKSHLPVSVVYPNGEADIRTYEIDKTLAKPVDFDMDEIVYGDFDEVAYVDLDEEKPITQKINLGIKRAVEFVGIGEATIKKGNAKITLSKNSITIAYKNKKTSISTPVNIYKPYRAYVDFSSKEIILNNIVFTGDFENEYAPIEIDGKFTIMDLKTYTAKPLALNTILSKMYPLFFQSPNVKTNNQFEIDRWFYLKFTATIPQLKDNELLFNIYSNNKVLYPHIYLKYSNNQGILRGTQTEYEGPYGTTVDFVESITIDSIFDNKDHTIEVFFLNTKFHPNIANHPRYSSTISIKIDGKFINSTKKPNISTKNYQQYAGSFFNANASFNNISFSSSINVKNALLVGF